jgi:hypothetical protein
MNAFGKERITRLYSWTPLGIIYLSACDFELAPNLIFGSCSTVEINQKITQIVWGDKNEIFPQKIICLLG